MEGNPVTTIETAPKLAEGLKRLAEKTKHPGAWSETFKKIKTNPEDPNQDLMLLLVDDILTRNRVKIPDNQKVKLADEYDALRESAGLDPADQTINHEALVAYLLRQKGIIKPLISRRNILRMGGAAAGLGIAGALVKPNSSASLILSPETKPTSIPLTPTTEVTPEKTDLKGDLIFEILGGRLETLALQKRSQESERVKTSNPELLKRGFAIQFGGLGYEQRLQGGEEFTDANYTIFLDRQKRQITVVNTPRDIDAPLLSKLRQAEELETMGFDSVNSAYETGKMIARKKNGGKSDPEAERKMGFATEKKLFTEVLGLDDLNVHLTIEGAMDLISTIVGKIPIQAIETIDDIQKSADGKTTYWELHVKEGQTYEMDGKQLVQYMQSRAGSKGEVGRNKRIQQAIDQALQTGFRKFNEANIVQKGIMLGNAAKKIHELQSSRQLYGDFDIDEVVGGTLLDAATAVGVGNGITVSKPEFRKLVLDESHGLMFVSQLKDPQAKEHYKEAPKKRPHLRVLDRDPGPAYFEPFRKAFAGTILQ